ncbi:MAG: hypothetical protein ABIO70_34535 [Pseudomonadota bacterium]
MPPDPRTEALCAAFLWWTAVLLVRALLAGLAFGAEIALAWGEQDQALQLPLTVGEAALSLVVLWGGIWAVLRPGGLALGPFWRQPWVLLLAALAFLGAGLLQLALPTVRAVLLGRLLPIEAFAGNLQWTSVIWSVHALLRLVSLAAAAGVLALRLSSRPPTALS